MQDTENKVRRVSTAWARTLSFIVNFAEQRGLNRGELLRCAGVSDAVVGDPDGRVPLSSLYDLVEAASESLSDPYLGMHVSASIQVQDMDALGFVMVTSPTFGAAMRRMIDYQRLWSDGERFEMFEENSIVRLTYETFGPERPAHLQMAQMAFYDMVVNGTQMIPGIEFRSVHFRQVPSAQAEEYRKTFPCPVYFGGGTNEVRFESRWLEFPMPDSNEALCSFFDRYTQEKLDRLPVESTVVEQVRLMLKTRLGTGQVKLEQVAESLHMSPRTLQRRLSGEGTSLHAELDEVRRQQALYFLEAGTSIAELSWLLGYAEPSVFHRAFKRWTDLSPEVWRAQRRRHQESILPRTQ